MLLFPFYRWGNQDPKGQETWPRLTAGEWCSWYPRALPLNPGSFHEAGLLFNDLNWKPWINLEEKVFSSRVVAFLKNVKLWFFSPCLGRRNNKYLKCLNFLNPLQPLTPFYFFKQSDFIFYFYYYFLFYFIYLFIFGCGGSSLLHASSKRGYASSQCTGYTSSRSLLLLWSTGSRHAGFSSCGTWAQ